MRGLMADLVAAARLLRRHAAFSSFVILTLAVMIGSSTAVFSLVRAVLLRALPFRHPDELVWMYNARTERDRAPFSIADLEDYRRESTTIAGLSVFTNWTANLTGSGVPERLEGTRVSGDFFELLGARPSIGRTLQRADEDGDARLVVLTHGLWIRRFGGDPRSVGQTISLNGAGYTVVGVLAPGFLFPFRDAELAVPLTLRTDPRRADRGANFLRVVARLKPGVQLREAKADLDRVARRLQQRYPDEDSRKTGVNLYPLHAEIVRDYRQILWTLFAAVAILLAVGCGNLADVMLVRAAGRMPELSLRTSLGASPGRILRQLGAEVTVLTMLGAALGLAFAQLALELWRRLGPANFPRMQDVAIDAPMLAFALGVSVVAALVCGLAPARFVNRDLAVSRGGGSRTATSGRRHGRVRRTLVALQLAGSAVLLVCMTLVARGFASLTRVDPGFAPDHAVSVQLSLPPREYASRDALARFADALTGRLTTIGTVQHVGAVSLLPLSGLLSAMDVVFPDRPAPPPDEVPQAHFRVATPGYFAAAGIPVLSGREFADSDTTTGRPVALVNRTFAERHWPHESALGKPLQLTQPGPTPVLQVVGVVNDVKQFALDSPPTADLYVPLAQMPASQAPLVAARFYWVVRSRGEPRTLATSVREAIAQIDPNVAASSLRTLDAVLASSLDPMRVSVRLFEVFGQVGVLLAAMGVYGIAAFSAGARRRELAIRAACGASRRDLIRLMLVEEMRPVMFGLASGLLLSFVAAPRLGTLLFTASPSAPSPYVAVAAGLLGVAMIAIYLPARQAAEPDPAQLLR